MSTSKLPTISALHGNFYLYKGSRVCYGVATPDDAYFAGAALLIRIIVLCTLIAAVHAPHTATLLHRAVIANDIHALKRLLGTQTVAIDVRDGNGRTALHHAARHAHRQAVEMLLAHGADVKAQDGEGKIPFMYAANNALETDAHAVVASVLLLATAGVRGRDEKGWRPLHWAVLGRDYKLVQQLVDAGASIWEGRNQSAVDVAMLMQDEEMLAFLIEAAGGIHAADEYETTPLMKFAMRGNAAAARLLLEQGVDPNATDHSNYTALMFAVERKQIETVEVLLEYDADVAIASSKVGNTALMFAAVGGDLAIVEMLLTRGAEVNVTNNYKRTALLYATERGHTDIVRALLKRKADVNIVGATGNCPLLHAARRGYLDIVTLLLARNAEVNIRNKFGDSPLLFAADGKHEEIVAMLLEKGAEVNSTSKDGKNPLIAAALRGHVRIVQLLLEQGAVFTAEHREFVQRNGGARMVMQVEATIRAATASL